MQSSSNQFLVGSIQQYANSLYLNQMAANMGMPSQMLPKLRTINKAYHLPIQANTNINFIHQRASSNEGGYNLWSGISFMGMLQHESSETLSIASSSPSKRKHSECSSSTLSSSPTSSVDYSSSNESNYNHRHHQRRGQDLPSTKAIAYNNNGLDFLAAVRKSSKLNACCSFCKNNGEAEKIYTSHTMKNSKGKVTCPLLKKYICPICGQTGDNAHTITYCKKYKLLKRENMLQGLPHSRD